MSGTSLGREHWHWVLADILAEARHLISPVWLEEMYSFSLSLSLLLVALSHKLNFILMLTSQFSHMLLEGHQLVTHRHV